jgi:cytochrome c oxidase cbb3-type subunit III
MNEINKNIQPGQDYEIDTLTNERLISDHEYDGIRELDNDLPPWWKWLFYICIVFLIVYLWRLFFTEAPDLRQDMEYAKEMARYESLRPAESESFEIILLTDEQSLINGKQLFDNNCAVCHLVSGAGIVGPNLTDEYWIHDNSLETMYNLVTEGVIEKGMLPYKELFSPSQRLEVIGYMITLYGSNPPNPKEPQGEPKEWPY